MKTIKMPRAMWEQWDRALRSGEYIRAEGTMYDAESGGYCCLGVLQHCLTGTVERDDEGRPCDIPTKMWLREHNITFHSKKITGTANFDAMQNPYLAELGESAAEANDRADSVGFIGIADAIQAAVEFTDA